MTHQATPILEQQTTHGHEDPLSYIFSTISQLSPSSQDLVVSTVNQLAQREGINVTPMGTRGLNVPAEGMDMWIIHLKRKRRSPATIDSYRRALRACLERDPMPTHLSVEQRFAEELERVSPARVKMIRNALRSFFDFLHTQGLWPTNPVAHLEGIPVPKRERRVPEDHEIATLLQQHTFRSTDDAKFRITRSGHQREPSCPVDYEGCPRAWWAVNISRRTAYLNCLLQNETTRSHISNSYADAPQPATFVPNLVPRRNRTALQSDPERPVGTQPSSPLLAHRS